MKMPSHRTREDWQKLEAHWLAEYACASATATATRLHAEDEHPYRTAFQRDRDRLVHARAFRRLKHKRQVFLITEGDHFRTRLTHTLEVAQISRTLGRALGLNEDLLEAIALGHDLGHTPFGHLGEEVLDGILQGRDTLEGALAPEARGGFKHNYQSLRIVDDLELKYEFAGLNLTAPVREGILKHTRLKRGHIRYPELNVQGLFFELDHATTLEGQIVAQADEIAQRTHDFEDGLRAGLVSPEEIRALEIVRRIEQEAGLQKLLAHNRYVYCNRLVNGLINLLVSDLIDETLRNAARFITAKGRARQFDEEIVRFSAVLDPLQRELNKFIYQKIIFTPENRRTDDDAVQVLRSLFRAYYEDPGLWPANAHFFIREQSRAQGRDYARGIADFIAGMTDHFALNEFERLQRRGLPLPQVNLAALRTPQAVKDREWKRED